MMDEDKPLCPICRDSRLETARFAKAVRHGGREIQVEELECWLCLECGVNPEFEDQRERNQARIASAVEASERAAEPVPTRLMLFTHPQSRGRTVRWLLEELNVPYEVTLLEYGKPMKTHEFRALNPMRKVPVLVDQGRVVTECAAICAYLADAFPEAGLAPPTAQRAAYYRWLFFAAGPLEQAMIHQALGVELSQEQQGFVGYGDVARVISTLEHALQQNTFIAGPSFTAADVYVGAQLAFGLQFKSIPKRKRLRAYVDRVTDREAFQRAAELDDQALAAAADASTSY